MRKLFSIAILMMVAVTSGLAQMSITVSDDTPCQGDTIVFAAENVPEDQGFFWYVEAANPQYPGSTDEPASVQMLADGYIYVVTPWLEQVCSLFIDVTPLPITQVSASPEGIVCPGTTITLTASGATSYTWYDELGNEVGSDPSILVSNGSEYSVIGQASGCSYPPQSVSIAYETMPELSNQYMYWKVWHSLEENTLSVCDDQYVSLSLLLENTVNYTYKTQWFSEEPLWWNGDSIFSYYATPPVTTGSYWAVTTTEHGCIYISDTIVITDDKEALPVPKTKVNGTVIIVLNPYQADGYQWYKDGVSIPNATSKKYKAKFSGNYVCRVKDEGCFVDTEPVQITLFNAGTTERIAELTSDPQVRELKLLDLMGREVNPAHVPKGTYLCTYTLLWEDGERDFITEKILIP